MGQETVAVRTSLCILLLLALAACQSSRTGEPVPSDPSLATPAQIGSLRFNITIDEVVAAMEPASGVRSDAMPAVCYPGAGDTAYLLVFSTANDDGEHRLIHIGVYREEELEQEFVPPRK